MQAALRVGVAPLEVREALYQVAPYIGFPRMDVIPSEALVFEDSANGLRAAAAGCMRAVWIADMAIVPPDVAQTAWLTCTSLEEVPAVLKRQK